MSSLSSGILCMEWVAIGETYKKKLTYKAKPVVSPQSFKFLITQTTLSQ